MLINYITRLKETRLHTHETELLKYWKNTGDERRLNRENAKRLFFLHGSTYDFRDRPANPSSSIPSPPSGPQPMSAYRNLSTEPQMKKRAFAALKERERDSVGGGDHPGREGTEDEAGRGRSVARALADPMSAEERLQCMPPLLSVHCPAESLTKRTNSCNLLTYSFLLFFIEEIFQNVEFLITKATWREKTWGDEGVSEICK